MVDEKKIIDKILRIWSENDCEICNHVNESYIDTKDIINELSKDISELMTKKGFWEKNDSIYFDITKLSLIISEITEAIERIRMKDISEEERKKLLSEELADGLIRILDYAGKRGLQLGNSFEKKIREELVRPYKHNKRC